MVTTMSDIAKAAPAVEASAVLTLKAPRHVPRQVLEDATFEVERILGEHVAKIAPGASACADFAHDSIEIDVSLTGRSLTELHQHLATVIEAIERHCELNLPDGEHNRLVLASSATHMTPPDTIAA
jgi:hypothetical protein